MRDRVSAVGASMMMTALIVEDNPWFRKFVIDFLAESVGEFLECADADTAFEIYRAEAPDVVVMDIGLAAKTSGIAATRRIVDFDPEAKVIIVTSHNEDDIRQAAKSAGAAAYVLKTDLGPLAVLIKRLSRSDS